MEGALPHTALTGPLGRLDLGRRILESSLADALTAPHGVDRYLELLTPTRAVREVRGQVADVRHRPGGSVTLGLRPTSSWRGFRAGQYVHLSVEIDGVRHTRCYSPVCSEQGCGERIELTVKEHSHGLVSRFLAAEARPGMVVRLSQPEGDFVLPRHRPDRVLLVSGGSGITPVMSMLRTLCEEGHRGAVTFLHYAPSAAEVGYGDELRDIAARHPNVEVFLSCTRADDGDLSGHFSAAHLEKVAPEYADAETYVCGPPGLIDSVTSLWRREGLERRLHLERFVAAPRAPAAGDGEGSVRFRRSGFTVDATPRPLLEQAEAAGLSPDYGCRMGICHTCTTRKIEGCVRSALTGELSAGDEEEVRLCVSVPAGDVTLDL